MLLVMLMQIHNSQDVNMSIYNEIFDDVSMEYTNMTIGTVVDANDPQQMGRLRIRCPGWGETPDKKVAELPWALYITPFGGANGGIGRGPEKNPTNSNDGSVAYGLWAIPKVGAQVLVACLDGDPNMRVWLGCMYDQFTPHTMPHGRFNGGDNLQGPHSSSGNFVQPYYDNLNIAFNDELDSKEFRTRAGDYTVAGVQERNVKIAETSQADDKEEKHRQGYEISRAESNHTSDYTDNNYDSQVYSLTTPGFHALSMDDRKQNCRIRIRTTSGNQIILDDSNERIYVSTAEGASWIEMDLNGNIDIYSERRISVHAENDINITSDEKIRMYGKKGVHIQTDEEFRLRTKKDITIKTDEKIHAYSKKDMNIESKEKVSFKAAKEMKVDTKAMNIQGSSDVKITGGKLDLLANGPLTMTGAPLNLNGPPAAPASPPSLTEPNDANLPNREPKHEPWPRVMYKKKSDKDKNPEQEVEFEKDSDSVGKIELGEDQDRGDNWHR